LAGGPGPLAATVRGIVDVSLDAMRTVNAIDGPCVYSVFRGQVVDAGELVARAKITPFALDESRVSEAEGVARRAGGLVRVRDFRAMRIGAVVRETLGERAMTRFRAALGEKIAWLGSQLLEPRFVADDPDAIGRAIVDLVDDGAEIIALAGTKAMDLLDPAFTALTRIDAQIERHGVPAHPGSLFWLARRGNVPIIGMPTCGLFSQATVFDLVLPRMLTGERIGRDELADLGHGGLLTKEMGFRFPPYRRTSDRGQVE
jgi:molybdopterin biosynthesis enzyme